MIVHAAHLNDDHLSECYFAERAGEPLDPRMVEHLSDCTSCETRYDEFREFMDGLREDADAEADELFTDDRLRLQQQQILQRLQHVQRSARVITFPGREETTSPVRPHGSRRAALAGGCSSGLPVRRRRPRRLGRFPAASASKPRSAPGATVQLPAAVVAAPAVLVNSANADPDDDAFLMELELALAAPHGRELQPFDVLTPHVRDIDIRER